MPSVQSQRQGGSALASIVCVAIRTPMCTTGGRMPSVQTQGSRWVNFSVVCVAIRAPMCTTGDSADTRQQVGQL